MKFFFKLLTLTIPVLAMMIPTKLMADWEQVGNSSTGNAIYNQIVVTDNSVYWAYSLQSLQFKASVRKYQNGSWSFVGSSGFSAGMADNLQLVVDNGTPYLAYRDYTCNYGLTVKKYQGGSWVTLGTNITGNKVNGISMVVDNGTVYISYRDYANGEKLSVRKYDGSWSFLGGSGGISSGKAYQTSITIEGASIYVAYKDNANSNKLSVLKYNGSWSYFGGSPGISSGYAEIPKITFFNGTPYIAYRDGSSGYKIKVIKYNGSSWQAVGNNVGSGFCGELTLKIANNGTPFVSFKEVSVCKAFKYTGSTWQQIGSSISGSFVAMDLGNDNSPYLALRNDNLWKGQVVKYGELPEMSIFGNSAEIADGDNSPVTSDHTDFGSIAANSGSITRTFTITNTANVDLNLTGSPLVNFSSNPSGYFSVSSQPTSPITSGNSKTFQVTYEPTAGGSHSAIINIINNDANENPYNFTIRGTGLVSEINLKQGATSITDNGSYDFGAHVTGTNTDIIFTLENTGNANLTITTPITIGGANANQFSIQQQPASAISPSGNTTFKVRFLPTATDFKTATISISNNDSNENPYDLTITGTGTIPSLSINNKSVTEGNSGYTNSNFTVSLSEASGYSVTVDYATANNTASAGNDYASNSGRLTFNPGETNKTITVQVAGDVIDENNETFYLNLSNPSNATISDNQGVGTITDDDDAPSLSINDVTVTEGNSGTSNAEFTVSLSSASGKSVTVEYVTANNTATMGSDFTSTSGTLTFSPGETNKTITVKISGDQIDEENETYYINLTNTSNATISDLQGVGTITDDDEAPTISINDVSVDEGNSGTTNANFTVSLSSASGKTVTVNYATADGTATTADNDYSGTNSSLTFTPGQTGKTISVAVKGDVTNESDETVLLNISNPSNATISDSQGQGTITNDDEPPEISINDIGVAEGNSGTKTMNFTISMNKPSSSTITVFYATSDNTTAAGVDYVPIPSTQLTFSPGQTSKNVGVLVNGDLIDESNETCYLNLSNPNYASFADNQGVGTINDDDDAPSISINDVTNTEGNSGTKDTEFTVLLSSQSGKTVTVNYATANNTAIAGSDYKSVSATPLTFDPGQTSKQVTVQVTGDTIDEENESYYVNLANASNATIADPQGVGTITDDDDAPTISINDVAVDEGNSGTTDADFTVSLSSASGKTAAVDYATANNSASAGTDYTSISTTNLTFNPGETSKTVTVQVKTDEIDENDETYYVNLSNASNTTISDNQGLGTITDDDDAPEISINDISVTEGNSSNTSAKFTVSLSRESASTITVDYATANNTATAGSDYTAVNTNTLTFDPGQTSKNVTVQVIGDVIDENNEFFYLNLSNPSNATISDSQGTGTITDDDDAPLLSITDVSVTEGNTGTTDAGFSVSLSSESAKTVTVNYATVNNSATAGSDYIAISATTLTFDPGQTIKNVTIKVTGDEIDEVNETYHVNLSDPSNATLSKSQGVGTITDDDDAPNISINDVSISEGDVGTKNADFTVILSSQSGKQITVNYTTTDNTATAGSDYDAITNKTLNFNPGEISKTVSVTIKSDTNYEGADENFYVDLANPTNATFIDNQGKCTIEEDDAYPEIAIKGKGQLIPDGATDPNDLDDTEFGDLPRGSNVEHTFTIENPGTALLTITAPINLTGSSDFTVTQQPATSVEPNGSTSFKVEFAPNSAGLKTANISINNNDAYENPYNFKIQGTGQEPEMVFKQGATPIANGGDHDFGAHPKNTDTDVTFTITNEGDADLTLSGSPIIKIGGANANQFSVLQQPTSAIIPSGSAVFQIRFSPTSKGVKNANISIANNDSDENPYDLTITGTGQEPEMALKQGTTVIPDGGNYDYGAQGSGTDTDITFTIENTGDANLTMDGTPILTINGINADQFSIQQQPVSPVAPSGKTTFIVRFSPTSSGQSTATISIAINDTDENPYDLTLFGIGKNTQPVATNTTQTQTYIEDATMVAIDDIVITDPDPTEQIIATLTLSNPATGILTKNSSKGETYNNITGVWTITGSVNDVNTALADVSFEPAKNNDLNATVTVNIKDGLEDNASPVTGTITLNVTTMNDAPFIYDINDTTIIEDTSTDLISFTVKDVETSSENLIVSGVSDNQILVPDNNIIFTGSGQDRQVRVTPASDQFGETIITLTVSDGELESDETFLLTVNGVNDVPNISEIADQFTDEDTPTNPIPFTVGDVETDPANLTVVAKSNRQTLIPDGNIIFDGDDSNRTIIITPKTEQSGQANITVSVFDGEHEIEETFVLTVNGVDDAPMISEITDQVTDEDTPTAVFPFTISDDNTNPRDLVVTAFSNNQKCAPNENIVLAGSDENRTIQITPGTNRSAVANPIVISVSVSDGKNEIVETFKLTINPVNDAPTISDIVDQTTREDTPTGAIPFTIADEESEAKDLNILFSSDNHLLVPNSNIVLSGSGENRTVRVVPLPEKFGSATITITVSDGESESNDTFLLTVTEVNDPPFISAIIDQTTTEDTPISAIAFTVSDAETSVEELTITATSDNETLVPPTNILLNGNGTNRTIKIIPAAQLSGSAIIIVTVSDGSSASSDSFTLTVNAVNDAPTISDITDQVTTEDTATDAIPFTIGDAETNANKLILTATSNNKMLVPQTNIVFGGKDTNRTVTVTPAAQQSGNTIIVITVSDGNSASSDTFSVMVNPVNDAPTIADIPDQMILEDTATDAIPFTIGDAETNASELSLTVTTDNKILVPQPNIVFVGNKSNRTVTITPAAQQFGNATIVIAVSDGSSASTDTFSVVVNPVNDAPTISDIANHLTQEDTPTASIHFIINDIETSANELLITAFSSNRELLPEININFEGENQNRTVTLAPAANLFGTSTITITISDGELFASENFVLTVEQVNDPPVIRNLPEILFDEDDSTTFDLDKFITDLDNDSTEISWKTNILLDGKLKASISNKKTDQDKLVQKGKNIRQDVVVSNIDNSARANVFISIDSLSHLVTVTSSKNYSCTYAQVEFTATDPDNQTCCDTTSLFIKPINDAPQWVNDLPELVMRKKYETIEIKKFLECVKDVDNARKELHLEIEETDQITNFKKDEDNLVLFITDPDLNYGTLDLKSIVSDSLSSDTTDFTIQVRINPVPTIEAVLKDNKIRIMWDELESDYLFAHHVYRSTDSTDVTAENIITIVPYPQSVFYDSTADWDTEFYYCVTSVDSEKCESGFSNFVQIKLTAEVDQPILHLPENFELSQNYPNPFNPTTTIQYTLPEKARVKITIFNIMGQEVAKLIDDEIEPGFHSILWDARNIKSGIYIYRIEAGEYIRVKKCLMIK
jgi:hypothetical protein